jgi:hypothetical protein
MQISDLRSLKQNQNFFIPSAPRKKSRKKRLKAGIPHEAERSDNRKSLIFNRRSVFTPPPPFIPPPFTMEGRWKTNNFSVVLYGAGL